MGLILSRSYLWSVSSFCCSCGIEVIEAIKTQAWLKGKFTHLPIWNGIRFLLWTSDNILLLSAAGYLYDTKTGTEITEVEPHFFSSYSCIAILYDSISEQNANIRKQWFSVLVCGKTESIICWTHYPRHSTLHLHLTVFSPFDTSTLENCTDSQCLLLLPTFEKQTRKPLRL